MKKQCAKCPWKKSTNPRGIPNGYCEIRHRNLAGTIARPGELNLGPIPMMACHESPVGEERVCVGWVVNQLGVGNNIGLRLRAVRTGEFDGMRTVGPQHERFEDTLPAAPRSCRGPGASRTTITEEKKR